MHAVSIVDGDLRWLEHEDPVPSGGEILIDVRAAGINAADLLQVRGLYPAPPGVPADIPGLEVAGVVAATGSDATRFSVGDKVMAVVGGGAQAQRIVVHERCAMAIPDHLDWAQAGGFPEAFTTAHDALFTQAGLTIGERVCIHGAAGGVGTAGIQLAIAAGADVVATVRNPELRSAVAELGANAVDPEGFRDHGPFDVILELIGAQNINADVGALAEHGRITVIGVGGGAKAEINLLGLMAARGRIHGSTLRSRPLEGKAAAAQLVERNVVPLLAAGRVRVPVSATFAMSAAAEAYEQFKAGGKFGKIVLRND